MYNQRVNYHHYKNHKVFEVLRGNQRINSNAYLNILGCQGCSVARNCASMEIHPRPREPQMENRRKKHFNLYTCSSCIDWAHRRARSFLHSAYCRDPIEISSGRGLRPFPFLTCFRSDSRECVHVRSPSRWTCNIRVGIILSRRKTVFLRRKNAGTVNRFAGIRSETRDVDTERNRLKLGIRDDSMKFNGIDCANVANKRMFTSVAMSRSRSALSLICPFAK